MRIFRAGFDVTNHKTSTFQFQVASYIAVFFLLSNGVFRNAIHVLIVETLQIAPS